MQRRTRGQSIVEMALILPLLLMILFGIIDLSYYIYGYSTIYQAARNGSEAAAQLPPFQSRLDAEPAVRLQDDCISKILAEVQKGAPMFSGLGDVNNVQISYPGSGGRALGQPISVAVTYNIEPLTPLFRFVMFGNNGRMTVRTTAQRSIESMGNNPTYANGIACQE